MRALLFTLLLLVTVAAAVAYSFGVVVPPGYYGIRQIGAGPQEGYQPVALHPGYHWGEPTGYYTTVALVPSTLQAVHFNREYKTKGVNEVHSEDEFWFPPINIETVDKGQILVDVTVLARLLPAPVYEGEKKISGGPADLAQQVGIGGNQWINRVRTDAEREIGEALRRLTNAEFYDPKLREHEGIQNAHKEINESLRQVGIEAEAVLLRRYTYEVSEVNKAIAEKNLQVQRERLSDFQRSFAEVEAQLVELKASGDAAITVIRETAPQEAKAIRSDGDLVFTQNQAKGDQLVAEAKAQSAKLKADIFAEMKEAKVYLARELAPLLSTLSGGIVSDIDPYDLGKWMEKLGLNERTTQ
ncbi:MAG: hypothetical protein KDD70_16025, partial [Bdellovibrionales bacterium]|nr:hypothetical protein [Bdellovibrionales bacterium]